MRALAREYVFKKIYVSLFNENDNENFELSEFIAFKSKSDKEFANSLFSLYEENHNEIAKTINDLLVDYSPERIFKIDRAILSVAITEIKYYKNTPVAVVINEAVELAKKYGTDKSYSFVNGLLKKVIEEKWWKKKHLQYLNYQCI